MWYLKKKIYLISTILLIVDQFVKHLVIANISYSDTIFLVPKFFYLTYVKNTGGAWSIFQDNFIFLLCISIAAIVFFFYYLSKKESYSIIEIIYLGLLFGGVLGNFIDRLCYYGVVDYLGFIFGSYYFPIFNIADISIVCGGILFLIDSFGGDKHGVTSRTN